MAIDAKCDAAILGDVSECNRATVTQIQTMVENNDSASTAVESSIKDLSNRTTLEADSASSLAADLGEQNAVLVQLGTTTAATFGKSVQGSHKLEKSMSSALDAQSQAVETAVHSRMPVLNKIQEQMGSVASSLQESEGKVAALVTKTAETTTASVECQRKVWDSLARFGEKKRSETKAEMETTLSVAGGLREKGVSERGAADRQCAGELEEIVAEMAETREKHANLAAGLGSDVSTFARDVIHAAETVAQPAGRLEIAYSSTLTATPPEEEILRVAGVDPLSVTGGVSPSDSTSDQTEEDGEMTAVATVATTAPTRPNTAPATSTAGRSKVAVSSAGGS